MNEEERTRTVTYLYISYIFTVFLFPVIYPLRKREDCAEDTVLSSHISWQSRTTLYTALVYSVAYVWYSYLLNPFSLVGLAVFFLLIPSLMIWIFYRVIKGISELADNACIPDERSAHRKSLNMKEAERKNTVVLLFISYAFILILPLFPLFSFIYLLIKRKDCTEDEVLSSHMSWQLRTVVAAFIVNISCIIIYLSNASLLTLTDAISFLPLLWVIYRVAKGIDKLSNNEAI